MSDTTKITKARVNGVLYDLGGSGGTGGVSGAWLAPGKLIESGYIDADSESRWEYMTIDPEALITQLEKAGVDVDESPFMDAGENLIYVNIGEYSEIASGYSTDPLIQISAEPVGMNIYILGSGGTTSSLLPKTQSLKELIYSYFSDVTDLKITVPNPSGFTILANCIEIVYDSVNTTLRYYIPDMSEFCDEVFVEYTPSSE